MKKEFLALFTVMAAFAAGAETVEEQMQRLFKERVQIYFKAEGLKRQVEAAVHDPAITSEAIVETRAAVDEARVQYITLNAKAAMLEREDKEVPEELVEKISAAVEALEAAQAKHREAVMEHPKVKVMADELARHDARAEEIKIEYEALQKQLNKEVSE